MENKYQDKQAFIAEKEKILSRDDLSKKGKVDDEIKDLVDAINSKEDYCTTSSCAGRITLLERKSSKKIDATWLYSSHNPALFSELNDNLKSSSDVWLMQESCILHIFCRNLDSASLFLQACRNAGFKRTGIVALKNKIMIETMGNEKVEALLIKDGDILVDEKYLKALVDESNSRMLKNRAKMNLLKKEVEKL